MRGMWLNEFDDQSWRRRGAVIAAIEGMIASRIRDEREPDGPAARALRRLMLSASPTAIAAAQRR